MAAQGHNPRPIERCESGEYGTGREVFQVEIGFRVWLVRVWTRRRPCCGTTRVGARVPDEAEQRRVGEGRGNHGSRQTGWQTAGGRASVTMVNGEGAGIVVPKESTRRQTGEKTIDLTSCFAGQRFPLSVISTKAIWIKAGDVTRSDTT